MKENPNCELKVPEGYRHCKECRALTPHVMERHEKYVCKVCGNYDFESFCDHCGAILNIDLKPESIVVESEDGEEITIYPEPFVFNYEEHYTWNDACSNPKVWSYDIRCPICGTINHMEDGNC